MAHGFDTVQEAWNIQLAPALVEALDGAKAEAVALDDRGGGAHTIEIGGETFQVRPHGGKGGTKWMLGNDDLLLMVRSPAQDWPVSVRYLAAGLWEHGWDGLSTRLENALSGVSEVRGDKWCVVSRFDYAWDFYAPEFTAEMADHNLVSQFVMHQGVKASRHHGINVYGKPGRMETITLGSMPGLQVQVYDKGREITEASGKTWMVELWERQGFHPPDGSLDHVWRLECRFGKAYLKERNIRGPDQVSEALSEMLTEALFTRRLTEKNAADTNKRRHAMHPLWAAAYEAAGADALPPLGRRVTGRRDALAHGLKKQAAGVARAISHLEAGGFDKDAVDRIFREAREMAEADPEGARKDRKIGERYSQVDEAR